MLNNFCLFNVIRKQEFDNIKINFIFENNILNEGILNTKYTKHNKKITYILI